MAISEGIFMKMLIKCGSEECRTEFAADTTDPFWKCPACAREIENRHFPFLNAKLMDSKVRPEKAEWKNLFHEHLKIIRDFSVEKLTKIKCIDPEFEIPGEYALDEFTEVDEGTEFTQKDLDRLLTKGHAIAIYLLDVLKDKKGE